MRWFFRLMFFVFLSHPFHFRHTHHRRVTAILPSPNRTPAITPFHSFPFLITFMYPYEHMVRSVVTRPLSGSHSALPHLVTISYHMTTTRPQFAECEHYASTVHATVHGDAPSLATTTAPIVPILSTPVYSCFSITTLPLLFYSSFSFHAPIPVFSYCLHFISFCFVVLFIFLFVSLFTSSWLFILLFHVFCCHAIAFPVLAFLFHSLVLFLRGMMVLFSLFSFLFCGLAGFWGSGSPVRYKVKNAHLQGRILSFDPTMITHNTQKTLVFRHFWRF